MPPLLGFSDNPLRSRDEVSRAATALLDTLTPYKSACGARIKVSTATGTGFDEISAQLEGFARPLWVVADILSVQAASSTNSIRAQNQDLDTWLRGLEAGVDPQSDEFWGHLGDHDQRMVEMEPIAYALLAAPSAFLPQPWTATDQDQQANQHRRNLVVAWLHSINNREVPPSNWRWFRVLVNLALVKSCGVPYNEVKPFMDADFKVLDSFYLADGWSSDGLWSADKKQADYYSGSFAMQYSQLAYVRFARDLDPERVERYRAEAREFSTTFWRYFNINGAAIPFGRSLTYRFAFAAFWSAISVTDISLPSPLSDRGVVKGILLRHLRWWASQPDIFNTDGTLNIGYTYPNMYMSEDYNSPQSLYWCLKSFSVLGLTEDHPFWTCEELPHPLSISNRLLPSHEVPFEQNSTQRHSLSLDPINVVSPPVHIVCSFREHHFLLSAGQFTRKTHKAREAKYSKFAYSSAFAFSVPTGPLLAQMAPDSTLIVSDDDGETWKVRWEPIAARIQNVELSLNIPSAHRPETVRTPSLISGWRPWRSSSLQIETILIPPLERWPGWHVRIHKLNWQTGQLPTSIHLVDAGFAISCQGSKGEILPQLKYDPDLQHTAESEQFNNVGMWEGDSACLILSGGGASGVSRLPGRPSIDSSSCQADTTHKCRGYILRPDANTNLIAQRTVIPTLYHHFDLRDNFDTVEQSGTRELCFMTGVFAVADSGGIDPAGLRKMWQEKPNLSVVEYLNLL